MNYRKAEQDVNDIQSLIHLNPNNIDLITKEKGALSSYLLASMAYEKCLQQKSKVTWLKLGDDSTRFFHASIKSRGSQN